MRKSIKPTINLVKDETGKIVFDPGGGGTIENPGHLWYPLISNVKQLLEKTKFSNLGKIDSLHYYNPDGTFELENLIIQKDLL